MLRCENKCYLLIISIIQSFRGRHIGGFICFPRLEQKRTEADHSVHQPKKLQKRENYLWIVLPYIRVAERHFLKAYYFLHYFKKF